MPISNMQALNYLPIGLHTLAAKVRNMEIDVINKNGGVPTILMVSGFADNGILACCFNWFAVSIVNYLRLISLVDLMNKNNWKSNDIAHQENHKEVKDYCREYVREVIPEIYRWRNKVAAHFAITDPFNNDNLGTLESSIMNPVSYHCPYFESGLISLVTNNQKSELPVWSLSKTFEILIPRFWPQVTLEQFPENK